MEWNNHSPGEYSNDEANAAFGGGAGRRLLALENESTTLDSLPIKSDDSTAIHQTDLSGLAADVDFSGPQQPFWGGGEQAECGGKKNQYSKTRVLFNLNLVSRGA